MAAHLDLGRGQQLGQRGQHDVHTLLLLQAADEGKERRRGVHGQAQLRLRPKCTIADVTR